MDAREIRLLAQQRRADAVTMIHRAGTGHTGGAMSVTDILCALCYGVMNIHPEEPDWPMRDRLLLSKGHSVEPYFAILADLGYFSKEELASFSQAGSRLIGHPNNAVPGIEVCTGALGHGLPVGVGMALAAKRMQQSWRTFVVMGDGEQAEGSVWEAAMAGAHYGLDNLFAIIDRNHLQISGNTEEVMALEDFHAKWEAFCWDVTETDGNNIEALLEYFSNVQPTGKPHCLIAHTTKGKGLPFAENRKEWHHKVPDAQQLQQAYEALGVKGVEWA